MEYAKLKGEAGSDVSLKDLGFQTDLRVYLHLRQTWLAFSKSPSSSGCGTGHGGCAPAPVPLRNRAWEEESTEIWGLLSLFMDLCKELS